jgi:hypothetical protein
MSISLIMWFLPALGPTQSPIQWILGLFSWIKQLGHGTNHPPPYSPKVKERVELCLYFSSGQYGLF